MALKSLAKKKIAPSKNTASKKAVPVKKKITKKGSVAKKVTAKKAVPTQKNIPTKTATKKTSVKKPAIVKTEDKKLAVKKAVEKASLAPTAEPVIKKKLITNAVAGKFNPVYNRADMFYKNTLNAVIEKRYIPGTPEDESFIAKGIDLSIKHNDRSKTIIEKSKEQDWNELYIEMFSNYPDKKGWVYTSQAEFIAYFFPGRVLWTKLEPIKSFCETIYNKAIESGIFKDLRYQYDKNSGRLSKAIKINTKTYSLNFYQIYTEVNGEPCYNLGIIMPFVLLMDFHIDYKIFKQ